MPAPTLILLTTDPHLVKVVEELLPGLQISAVACLRDIPEPRRTDRLAIDPRSAARCCIERLRGLRLRLAPRRIHYLCLPARPEVLLTLPRVAPGTVTRIEELPALIGRQRRRSRAPLAWENRHRILSADGRPDRARHFLHLARMHSNDRYTVSEAAFDLDLHVRRLTRLSIEWFEYSPGIVISLSRITSLEKEIAATTTLLRVLAHAFGFRDQAAMTREFTRFASISPSVYREFHLSRRLSETAKSPSENAG